MELSSRTQDTQTNISGTVEITNITSGNHQRLASNQIDEFNFLLATFYRQLKCFTLKRRVLLFDRGDRDRMPIGRSREMGRVPQYLDVDGSRLSWATIPVVIWDRLTTAKF